MLTVTNATTGVARSAKKWYNKRKEKKRLVSINFSFQIIF